MVALFGRFLSSDCATSARSRAAGLVRVCATHPEQLVSPGPAGVNRLELAG